MKTSLVQIIILTLSAALMIIAIHQTFTVGFGQAYWIFMFSISMLLLYSYRKNKA